jgi:hypothetical protein
MPRFRLEVKRIMHEYATVYVDAEDENAACDTVENMDTNKFDWTWDGHDHFTILSEEPAAAED